MFLRDSSLELFSHITSTFIIMGKLTSVSGGSLLKTRKQQKYTNQEKLQLADTVAKKRVIDEGMGVRGFCQNLVNYIKMFVFSKGFGSRTISKKKSFSSTYESYFQLELPIHYHKFF